MAGTLYDTLGISSSAGSDEIKTAYKQLAKKYHPDKNPGSNWHEEQFKKINHAYQVLSDAVKKKQYDDRLAYETFQRQNPRPSYSSQEYKKPPVQHQATYRKPPATNTNSYSTFLIVAGFFLIVGILGFFLYTFMNRYAAEDAYKKALVLEQQGSHKQAFMLYTDAIGFDKEYAEAYEKRADARINSILDYTGAEYDYTNAIVNSENPSGQLYFKRANCLINLKKYNLAMIDLDSAIRKDKALDSAIFYKAEVNYFIENYSKAIPDYSAFLTLHPEAVEVLLKRGFCYYKTEQYKKALQDFDTILSTHPEEAETFYYRGITHFALKDSTRGCTDLNYALVFGLADAAAAQKKYCR